MCSFDENRILIRGGKVLPPLVLVRFFRLFGNLPPGETCPKLARQSLPRRCDANHAWSGGGRFLGNGIDTNRKHRIAPMSEIKHRVFIFASDPIVAELTQFRLKLLDHDPIVISGEEELEEALNETLPSLFIIDLDLVETDAMQLIERFSSDEVTSRIPVMCMSQEGDMDRAEKAYLAGARDFLVIPYDPIVLERKVVGLLERAKAQAKTQLSAR